MQALTPSPDCVAAARAQALVLCAEQGLDAERCDALALVVSELVGNAVRHGGPPLRFDVVLDGTDLLVLVEDGDASPPARRAATPGEAEDGRGMLLVTALTRRWGWHPVAAGKRVWARL